MTQEDQNQVREIIRQELSTFILSDRYVFQKHIQLFDGKNIQVAKGTGTQIGTEAAQKITFHGATPCIQADAIASPSETSASLKIAVDLIRVALTNKGLTA